MAAGPANFCDQCGVPLAMGAKFCAHCGKAVAEASPAESIKQPLANWQMDVPLINNRFIMADVFKACGLTALFMAILLGFIFGLDGGMNGVKQAIIAAGIALIGLLVMSVLVMAVFLGNTYRMEFVLTAKEAKMVSRSDRAHTANRLALILGLLSGKPGAAGAGLLAVSREIRAVRWADVRQVLLYPEQCVIVLKGGLLETIHLYCTVQNYAAVNALVDAHAGKQALPDNNAD